jgi:hypothetical protein
MARIGDPENALRVQRRIKACARCRKKKTKVLVGDPRTDVGSAMENCPHVQDVSLRENLVMVQTILRVISFPEVYVIF